MDGFFSKNLLYCSTSMKKILYIFLLITFLAGSFVFAEAPNHPPSLRIPPQALVIFGATGDLTKRKIIPALLELEKKGELPKEFVCIGMGRRSLSEEEFRKEVGSFISNKDQKIWENFSKKVHYLAGPIEKKETYVQLAETLSKVAAKNFLFYLATPETHFLTIIEQLDQNQLLKEENRFSRVIIEKPFGHDTVSALELQKQIALHLKDKQTYRIDHFLGKEMIHNLLTFRFANQFIESFWNQKYIDQVAITISEEIGVETRGSFFEQTGLLRDIVQNHAMQIVSLIGMEKPKQLTVDEIRKEKTKLIEAIRPIDLENDIIRGQYGPGIVNGKKVVGYRQEPGVSENSNVETYVQAKLFIDNPRWKNVPFIIKSGKRLPEKKTEIVITFKAEQGAAPNQLTIQVQPKEEISLMINSEMPGFDGKTAPKKLLLGSEKGSFPEAYERLLHDAMSGDDAYFVSFEELLASWKLFSPVLEYWEKNPPKQFPNYVANTNPP